MDTQRHSVIAEDRPIGMARRDIVRRYALRPQQQAFVHVVPAETGMSRTVWVSQSERYPAFLVAPNPGRAVHPPKDVMVFWFGEDTPFVDVNVWLARNRHLLAPLASQNIDIGHFYDEMEVISPAHLREMVNLPRRETRLPMIVYCSPRNAKHDVRVKVSPNHGDKMQERGAISIAVRPSPHYPSDEKRRLSPDDFDEVCAWIAKNEKNIIDYWEMAIDTAEFRRRIAASSLG